jgi:hypothetical protein
VLYNILTNHNPKMKQQVQNAFKTFKQQQGQITQNQASPLAPS